MVGRKAHFQWLRTPILALTVSLAACSGDGSSSTFLSLGTAGTGGIWYPLGGAIAGLLSVADDNYQVSAEVTGGAVENINRIRAGQIDLAFSTANTVYDAYYGSPDFDGTVPNLRVLAPLYANPDSRFSVCWIRRTACRGFSRSQGFCRGPRKWY